MANLNEKQLLLLNCLVYVDADFADGRSLGDIATELLEPGGLDGVDIGAKMTQDEVRTLLQDVLADDAVSRLKVDGYVNTEIRAACFVDPTTRDAVVVYRGTGPAYAAWDDNCQGGYLSDTDMQKEALDFAQWSADKYGDITVTGHSKGGNMAQYVTVRMGDRVDRCVSFDGQGFGDEFMEKYADEIAANKDKIRSVNAYNDYVNILLTPIAGETVYLDNIFDVGPKGHSPYGIYAESKNKLTDGEYTNTRKQGFMAKWIKEKVQELVEEIEGSDSDAYEWLMYSIAGMLAGLALNDEDIGSLKDWFEKIRSEIEKNLDDVFDQIREGSSASFHVALSVDTAALRETGGILGTAAAEVQNLYAQVQKIRRQMASNIVSGVAIGVPLQIVMKQLDKEATKLEKLSAFLANSADLYDTAENDSKNLV